MTKDQHNKLEETQRCLDETSAKTKQEIDKDLDEILQELGVARYLRKYVNHLRQERDDAITREKEAEGLAEHRAETIATLANFERNIKRALRLPGRGSYTEWANECRTAYDQRDAAERRAEELERVQLIILRNEAEQRARADAAEKRAEEVRQELAGAIHTADHWKEKAVDGVRSQSRLVDALREAKDEIEKPGQRWNRERVLAIIDAALTDTHEPAPCEKCDCLAELVRRAIPAIESLGGAKAPDWLDDARVALAEGDAC